MTDVSAWSDEGRGKSGSMLQRFFAPIANVLRWAEPFDWDDDEP